MTPLTFEPLLPIPYFYIVIYTTRGIVLRNVKYGETSMITDIFTESRGHQTFIIHGVRKAKASTPFAYLQLMSLVEMVAYFKEGRKIHHIKEIRLDPAFQSIPFDMQKSSVITCLAEICSKCMTTADPHPELFQFVHNHLTTYDTSEDYDRDFLLRFLTGLSNFLGFGLDTNVIIPENGFFDLLEGHFVPTRGSHDYLMSIEDYQIMIDLLTAGSHHQPTTLPGTRRRIIDQIITYYQLHVDTLRDLKSLKILRELF